MTMVRMDIESVVVGNGPVASMLILRPRDPQGPMGGMQLPIRIGLVEATAISAGVDGSSHVRPMTHDLLTSTISALGATVSNVSVNRVEGPTFFASVNLLSHGGEHLTVDARPSDAIALAVRSHAPIYASAEVLQTAAYPSFGAVKRDEQEQELEKFHEFLDGLTPDDFLAGDEHDNGPQQ